jgi:hypothetical protein
MLSQRKFKGRRKIRVAYPVKRRDFKRGRPVIQQRIGHGENLLLSPPYVGDQQAAIECASHFRNDAIPT